MAAQLPEIAVIIPLYNCGKYIERTLRSILDQEGVRVEVVVSDDGSTDNSRELVRGLNDPRVMLVMNKGKGVADGLNTALGHVTAPIVCRCDGDDWYTPGRLALQVKILRDRPEIGAVCGQFETMTHDEEILAEMGCGDVSMDISPELQSGTLRTHLNTWAFRTDLLRALGGFRNFGLSGEDNDIQLRAGENARVWFEARVFYTWRLHHASITHTQPSEARIWAAQLAFVLQKQRRERGGVDDLMLGKKPDPPPGLQAIPPTSVEEQIFGILLGHAWHEHARGRRISAVRAGIRAAMKRPGAIGAWKNVVKLALKPARPGARSGV
jgi:glycosyltransferase involved in cell wall biosynthesis